MTFTEAQKDCLRIICSKASASSDVLGAEALFRFFKTYPAGKTYFPHMDLSAGSTDLLSHGGKVMHAIGSAIENLDHIEEELSSLSDLHAESLKIDPGNFGVLSHSILVVLANHFPADFTPVAHVAWDKLLCLVSAVLVSKYR
ncbi:hemoglobin subunit alpha-5 [Bombina bombina]|uniref:hemoglobin subunit alpha-5 n=1 Tax=Bombina bombina TaxID=8345 RepID=UPI00235B15F7|nr:hemoglobin subunit alpha-5 [Bombina bombina]